MREGEELPGGGAAEAVDRLVGVAHRGDAVPQPGRVVLGAARAEQPGEDPHLGVGGVLELVQQHHGEPRALLLAGRRHLDGDARRVAQQVTEVHDVLLALDLVVAGHEVRHEGAVRQTGQELLDLLRGGLGARGQRQGAPLLGQPGEELAHLVRTHQVLGHVPGQPQRLRDEPGRGHAEGVRDHRMRTHDGAHEPVGVRASEQPRLRFHADPQAVVPDERAGVGVVRGHRGAAQVLGLPVEAGDLEAGAQQGVHAPIDPLGELTGRLPGERDAEDLVRAHETVGHEPDHAVGHGGGLAGAGAGQHQARSERGGDHLGLLLRGRGQPQPCRDVLRRVDRVLDARTIGLGGGIAGQRGHSVTCLPSEQSGQTEGSAHRRAPAS